MKDEHDAVALYEKVARLTSEMLSAAHRNDWDQLTELEAGCANCVEKIKGCSAAAPLSAEASRQKVAHLKTILKNDREIRQLTQPWMEKLTLLLGNANAECKLARAYRSAPE